MMCTFYYGGELLDAAIGDHLDKSLNELYQDVRKLNPNLFVLKSFTRKRRWFAQNEVVEHYTMVIVRDGQGPVSIGGIYEVVVFNWPVPLDAESSIRSATTREGLMAFLFGYFNGWEHHKADNNA